MKNNENIMMKKNAKGIMTEGRKIQTITSNNKLFVKFKTENQNQYWHDS